MANILLTPQQITREGLRVLHQKLTFVGNINRQYDNQFAKSGAKIGDTLKIRLPNQYTVRTGKTLSTQDTTETNTTLQVATQAGVDVNFSSSELTLSLDDFSKRILDPAMSRLAAHIEADALNMYKDVYNLVGTPGTVPSTLLTYLQAKQKLDESLTPMDSKRSAHLLPVSTVSLVDGLKSLFQDSKEIAEQYREGMMGRTAGLDFYQNTLLPTHTTGADFTTVTVNGATQTGATLASLGGDFKKGDVITIAGVYQVHPETKATMPNLQQFVITADGTTSLGISPPIVTSGALQTVSASPANGAVITAVGTASTNYGQNLAFHEDAFTFATADLILPQGVDFARREVFDGISMRIVRAYDINNDNLPCRIDVLYGYKTIRPQMACRITN
ncbi:MAG: P22 phage major capsid protein family protein [Methylococcaceae bacterium]